MSSNYGTAVKLPGASSANNLRSIGGQVKGKGTDAKNFISITKTPPANNGNAGKIALNGMGKNGTMMLKTTKKGRSK